MPVITNQMQWEKVAIPLASGVNLGVRARLAEPTNLLEATNVFYPVAGGPEKRKGYAGSDIQNNLLLPTPDSNYTYGFGAGPLEGDRFQYSNAGDIRSIVKRDTETVIQASESLYNNKRLVTNRFHNFSATSKPIAKTQNSQGLSDLADNGVIKVVSFRNYFNGTARIYCYDSTTGALIFNGISTVVDPEYITVVPVGEYIHVYISDVGDNTLYLHVISPMTLSLGSPIDLGECHIDYNVVVVTDNSVLVTRRSLSDDLYGGYITATGNVSSSVEYGITITSGVTNYGIAFNPKNSTFGIVYSDSVNQHSIVVDTELVPLGTPQLLTAFTNKKITVAPVVSKNNTFTCFIDSTSSKTVNAFTFDITTFSVGNTIFNSVLAGKAFTIGAAQFAWVCRISPLQTTYLIVNYEMEVVGKLEYGTAVSNIADSRMFSSNVIGNKVHGSIDYARNIVDQPGIFHETSIKEFVLDFDFRPRPVQVGRSVYYPGAQVLCYDGDYVSENCFNFAPEDNQFTTSNGAGSLTNSAEYYYIIYACHKNAQGEEVRSPAILSSKVTMGASDDTVTINIKTIPTLREDSYFLVFRNANAGTNWHLVSNRDPQSAYCPKNTHKTTATVTFIDLVSDANLVSRELDSFTADNYLIPFAAPSCTLLAYGKDRLWAAGGEIPGSQVLPSRLFDSYETPTFHPALALDIDKTLDSVTAIGFIADYTVVFKRSNIYILVGDGVDNTIVGNNYITQKALSDIGAISSAVKSIAPGLVFLSDGGYRLLSPGGTVTDIGEPVKTLESTCLGMHIDIENSSILIYQDNCTLVFNYNYKLWTKWTSTTECVTDCEFISNGNRILTRYDGYLDNDSTYEVRIKTAPFQSQLGNFSRIRRVAGIGYGQGEFTINTYYDEKEYPNDSFLISKPDNSSTWGDTTWGSGFWGNSSGTQLFADDDRLRWVRRVTTQKCSCISLEIVYNKNYKGPIHTAFVIEFGTKNGIDRSK